jgi:hypothetical protein
MDTFFWLMMGATYLLYRIVKNTLTGRGKHSDVGDQTDPFDIYNPLSANYIGDLVRDPYDEGR